jgi:hypothetical protein
LFNLLITILAYMQAQQWHNADVKIENIEVYCSGKGEKFQRTDHVHVSTDCDKNWYFLCANNKLIFVKSVTLISVFK